MSNIEKAVLHLIKAYQDVDQSILNLSKEDQEREKLLNTSCELMDVVERLKERCTYDK